jgi:hypothetical protein
MNIEDMAILAMLIKTNFVHMTSIEKQETYNQWLKVAKELKQLNQNEEAQPKKQKRTKEQ